jgi:MoaA/NifB/PqqE/SkfB family radical SAM enzyme
LSVEDTAQAYRDAEELKVFEITLSGGEPLTWRGMEYAMSASHNLRFSALQLITNATLVNQERLDLIKNSNLQRICVSLDGLEEVHTRNRGVGRYQATIKGIRALRDAVDNITVISVLDATNHDRWPELTRVLLDEGVKQHHLAPVCFAGDAMNAYKGLSQQQFDEVRKRVDLLAPELMDRLVLQFNDVVLRPPTVRTVSMTTFTEAVQGWMVLVRPDRSINASVQYWGRSWRRNEVIGNISEISITHAWERTAGERGELLASQFSNQELRRRKFHVGTSLPFIQADLEAVQAVNTGRAVPTQGTPEAEPDSKNRQTDETSHERTANLAEWLELPLKEPLSEMKQTYDSDPSRFRLRRENGFGLLFDRTTFEVTLLREAEVETLFASTA